MTFKNITLIEGKNNGQYPFCNTLLINDSIKVLIDPACGRKKMEAVKETAKVDIIIATHYHEDHICYNYLFPDAKIYIHNYDEKGISSIEGYLEVGIEEMDLALKKEWKKLLIERFHFLGWKPEHLLMDNEELRFGDTKAIIIHTPGHTPGHICIHFPENEVLYLGDIDLSNFGPWYGDKLSNIDSFIESIKKVMKIKARWYIPAHGGPVFDDIEELGQKYLDKIEEREQLIFENLKHPISLDDLCNKWLIYKKPRNPVEFYSPSERAMLKKHLERLIKTGRVAFIENKYVAI